MGRAQASLEASGFDALVIHAGCPPIQFLDDQDYSYKVNPHFKAWVPVLDNPGCLLVYSPGTKPHLLFHQPNDYWHKTADLPEGGWSGALDVTAISEPSKAAAF